MGTIPTKAEIEEATEAVKKGDVKAIREMVTRTPALATTPIHASSGETLLTFAAYLSDSPDMVNAIIEANPRALLVRDAKGRTALHHAAGNVNRQAIMTALLEKEPSLATATDHNGFNVLHEMATWNTSGPAIQWFGKQHPELLRATSKTGNTPLAYAITWGELTGGRSIAESRPDACRFRATGAAEAARIGKKSACRMWP